jgi:hypothetical protein
VVKEGCSNGLCTCGSSIYLVMHSVTSLCMAGGFQLLFVVNVSAFGDAAHNGILTMLRFQQEMQTIVRVKIHSANSLTASMSQTQQLVERMQAFFCTATMLKNLS